jgi:cytidine deaminase
MNSREEDLISAAKRASAMAYSPYSGFKVGAALLTEDGEIYTGCNIENASYSLTVCAERNAVAQAVKEGKTGFVALAVFVDSDVLFPPCGACRQVLSEFSRDMVIIYTNNVESKKTTLSELLPQSFSLKSSAEKI